jgi:alanine racemase
MRSTFAEISLSDIRHNIRSIRRFTSNTPMMAIVKANAYGHGIVEVSRVLRGENVSCLGVAFAGEAEQLRRSGDDGEIMLIVPPSRFDAESVVKYDLQISAADIDAVAAISAEAMKNNKKIKAHLFIDTGMHRDGIRPDEAVDFMEKASAMRGIEMYGIMTHFATADCPDKTFALGQLDVFNRAISDLKKAGYEFRLTHACNSAAMVNLPEAWFDMVRPGISIYGMMPESSLTEKINLNPALQLISQVIKTKSVRKGETVGYSMKYVARKNIRIAVVPLGYGDGYFRALTNKSHCLINGRKYRLVGSVCMDQLMVDIGEDDVKIGDRVVLIGNDRGNTITANHLADMIDTIPYEITTSILQRIPRKYTDE